MPIDDNLGLKLKAALRGDAGAYERFKRACAGKTLSGEALAIYILKKATDEENLAQMEPEALVFFSGILRGYAENFRRERSSERTEKAKQYDQKGLTYLSTAVDTHHHPDAQHQLATLYAKGVETVLEKNPSRSFDLLKNAADQGHAMAQCDLAANLAKGVKDVVEQDMKQALDWWHRSAEQKYPPAQHRLATCYRKGVDGLIEKDMSQFVDYLNKAAEKHAPAAHELAQLYLHGFSESVEGIPKVVVPENRQQGLKQLGKAMDLKSPEAAYQLGEILITGNYRVQKDPAQALACYQRSAQWGYPPAQKKLQEIDPFRFNVRIEQMSEEIRALKQVVQEQRKLIQTFMGRAAPSGATQEEALAATETSENILGT